MDNVVSLILSVQQCTAGVELTAAAPEIPRDDHKLSSQTSYMQEWFGFPHVFGNYMVGTDMARADLVTRVVRKRRYSSSMAQSITVQFTKHTHKPKQL